MTNAGQAAKKNSATDLEDITSDWIERRDRGDWDSASQSQFDAWLARSLENRIAYWRLEAAWDRTERLAALRGTETGHASQARNTRLLRRIAKIGGS